MRIRLLLSMLVLMLQASAQGFFNLTAEEVKIDSVLPRFAYSQQLGPDYADSVYTVSIDYPEFIDMHPADVDRLLLITTDSLPAMPQVDVGIGRSRRQGTLSVSFVPLVWRDGRYQKLVSFKLTVHAAPAAKSRRAKAPAAAERYASHSVLADGRWAKIRVSETGVHQLTDALLRQAGFSNPAKVKIYGYGGALQPEVLTGDYLALTDDLKEVPTCMVGGRRFFYAVGPVSWSSNSALARTRNPYSDYGYYFLTESDDEPLTADSAQFVGSFYPSADDYHSLYEVDDFAWYHSGRNLYMSTLLSTSDDLVVQLPAHETSGTLSVAVSYDGACEATVSLNDSLLSNVTMGNNLGRYAKAGAQTVRLQLNGCLQPLNRIAIRQTSGTEMRLDYVSLTMPAPAPAPNLLSGSFPVPQYVYNITNQDHHADSPVDMVIIIPTTQKVLAQAERLKHLHETNDSLRVRIVPADELYNEFSSGTPDANAYRRYLKMLYDRAETEADMPRYLLLFGDGAWDNRMLTSNWRTSSPDDYLLCYESENSFSETDSYVSDDYFCLLDDGEGASLQVRDLTDVAVGRLPASTAEEAKIMVDKIVGYANNDYAGDWQNVLCFLADDLNQHQHMLDAEKGIATVNGISDAFNIKKIYWDVYKRVTTSAGNRYPDASQLAKQQMSNGALIINYTGHGSAYQISHEKVLERADFATPTSLRLPLWITASCDIMPFDSHEENIGETAMLNPKGGCVAFFGTTRTVLMNDNTLMDCAFLKHVLGTRNGRRNTMGDAVQLAKNELRMLNKESSAINKLHYSLLGDPALTLAMPTTPIVVDSINGCDARQAMATLTAGMPVVVKGHVDGCPQFDGIVALTVKDVEEKVVCRMNEKEDGAETPFEFYDRPVTIYNGSDSVRGGQFEVTFVMPRDISYSDAAGLMTLYARNSEKSLTAHGRNEAFSMRGDADVPNDGIGPSIYCYLNSSAFVNGGKVNSTPYFYAELTDKNGINVSGSGVGHDLELIIDGSMDMTYNLNDYFQYDFGDYRCGSVGFSLPELPEGHHSLLFRAWDVLNNPSVAELKFQVVKGIDPQFVSVDCTHNPATTQTAFVISHDRAGSNVTVEIELFDASGRQLWHHREQGLSAGGNYVIDWDLTVDGGRRLSTGVYLYRATVECDGTKKASKAKKLIILTKN